MQDNERLSDLVLRFSVECAFCGHENTLTMAAMPGYTKVSCGLCGGKLGTIAELVGASDSSSGKPVSALSDLRAPAA
jgi:transcription elongation factor Elf1